MPPQSWYFRLRITMTIQKIRAKMKLFLTHIARESHATFRVDFAGGTGTFFP
jgi:hypothetical protein